MRILYYYPNYETPMFQWQKKHIFDEMECHGCYFDIISPFDYESIDQVNEIIVQKTKNHEYQLFMTSYSTNYLYLDTLERIKRNGVKTLCFCPDNLTVPYNQRAIAKYFDLVWLTSKETEYLFKRWGAKTIFLPYASNPNLLKPNWNVKEINRLAFIGTPHGSRVERVNMLLQSQVPISLYSKKTDTSNIQFRASAGEYRKAIVNYLKYPIGRKLLYATIKDKLGRHEINLNSEMLELKQPVSLEELGRVNSSYALVLAFTEANSTGVLKNPVPIVNLRNFEIPMSGGLEITLFTEELASYFEPDKEIILCSCKEELVDKTKFFLQDKQYSIRMKMKENARKRAEAEHTWFNRFELIFKELELLY